jgi:chorismate mutase / prephenate dehydratase
LKDAKMNIELYRKEIDLIDEKILRLLSQRAELALKIGQEKNKNNLAILSREREKEIIDRLTSLNSGSLPNGDIETIFRLIIEKCRNLQKTSKP